MFPLCRQAVVAGHDRPAICKLANFAAAGVDHWLNGEQHTRHQFHARAGLAIMQHLRIFVETLADAVTAEFTHDRKPIGFGVLLDGVAHVAQGGAVLDLLDALPHTLEGDLGQAARQDGLFTHGVHAAGVAEPAILDDGDVDIERVPIFQHLVARNAVANLMVHRRTDGAGEGRVAGRGVAHRGGLDLQFVSQVFQAETIQLAGGDTRLHVGSDEIENFGGVLAGGAHLGQVGRIGNCAHGVT
ncbi:hypothetical protein D3C73_1146850 [compost metagenome]